MDKWINRFNLNHSICIFVPSDESRKIGGEIKAVIEKSYTFPVFYFHLKNGSHIKALDVHIQHKYFASLDIINFFGNINRSRVTRVLKDFFPYDDAREFANWSVVKDVDRMKYTLPFGFIQSPILASLCLDKSRLGKALRSVNNLDVAVSVYMDDIVLSSNNKALLDDSLEKIKGAAIKSKFPLNKDKQNSLSEKITVFNIDLSHEYLQVNSERIREFQAVYNNTDSNKKKLGILNYIKTINPIQGQQFIDKINEL